MSNILEVKPGSTEWNKLLSSYIVSSEAPIVMKVDSTERLDLIRDKATGDIEKPSLRTIVDDTGRAEAQAMIEDSMGDDFYSAVYSDGSMLADLHGVNMEDTIIFRHHPWHSALAADIEKGELPPLAYWQLEFELMVSGAESAVFVVSDGTVEKFASVQYQSIPERAEQLAEECERFMQELNGERNRTLPAITYRFEGLAVRSNLSEYQESADQLVKDSKLPIQNDADFDNRKLLIKALETGEKRLGEVQSDVMGEITDVDAFIKHVKKIQSTLRTARLATQKLVTSESQRIKNEIAVKAARKFSSHLDQMTDELGYKIKVTFDPSEAMKKKRNFESMEKAVNEALETARSSIDAEADKARANLAVYKAAEHNFLFPDLAQFVFSPVSEFQKLVSSRVEAHAEAEKKRLEAEREQIRLEEQKKAEAEATKKLKAQQEAEAKKLEEQRIAEQTAIVEPETVEDDMAVLGSEMGVDDHVEAAQVVESPVTIPRLDSSGKVPVSKVTISKGEVPHVMIGGSTRSGRTVETEALIESEFSSSELRRVIESLEKLEVVCGDLKTEYRSVYNFLQRLRN